MRRCLLTVATNPLVLQTYQWMLGREAVFTVRPALSQHLPHRPSAVPYHTALFKCLFFLPTRALTSFRVREISSLPILHGQTMASCLPTVSTIMGVIYGQLWPSYFAAVYIAYLACQPLSISSMRHCDLAGEMLKECYGVVDGAAHLSTHFSLLALYAFDCAQISLPLVIKLQYSKL